MVVVVAAVVVRIECEVRIILYSTQIVITQLRFLLLVAIIIAEAPNTHRVNALRIYVYSISISSVDKYIHMYVSVCLFSLNTTGDRAVSSQLSAAVITIRHPQSAVGYRKPKEEPIGLPDMTMCALTPR